MHIVYIVALGFDSPLNKELWILSNVYFTENCKN